MRFGPGGGGFISSERSQGWDTTERGNQKGSKSNHALFLKISKSKSGIGPPTLGETTWPGGSWVLG